MTSNGDASTADLPTGEKPIDRDSLYAELVALRRPGLRRKLPDDLAISGLRRIAKIVSPNVANEDERLKDTMRVAVNSRRLGEGDYSAAIADLWGIDTTFSTASTKRREAAIERLEVAESTFNRRIQKEMTEALADELLHLLAGAGDEETYPSTDESPAIARRIQAVIGGRKRRGIVFTALVIIGLTVVGIIMLRGEKASTPPKGTVVNAETGALEPRGVQTVGADSVTGIAGGNILRACNLSKEKPCGYPLEPTPIRANVGDLITFKLRLHNYSYEQLPYAKFGLRWAFFHLQSQLPKDRYVRFSRIRADMVIRWPYKGNAGIGSPASIYPVIMLVPLGRTATGLSYIPGSTKLLDSESHTLASLPDGISENGVALTHIGPPSGCRSCDGLSFIRFIEFKMLVTKDQRL